MGSVQHPGVGAATGGSAEAAGVAGVDARVDAAPPLSGPSGRAAHAGTRGMGGGGRAASADQIPDVCLTVGRELEKLFDVADRDLDAAATIVCPPPAAAAALRQVRSADVGGDEAGDAGDAGEAGVVAQEKERRGAAGIVVEYFPLLKSVVVDVSAELKGYMSRILQQQERCIRDRVTALSVTIHAGRIAPGGRPAPAGVESVEEDAVLPEDLVKCATAIAVHLLRPWAALR